MARRYAAVIFDFDGTLADTLEGIVRGMALAFAEVGLAAPDPRVVARTIGVPLYDIVATLLPASHRTPARITDVMERYRAAQPALLPTTLRLFPGAPELLVRLRGAGVRLAVASNKMRRDLVQHMQLLGIVEFFEQSDGGDDHPPAQRKPHPAPLLGLARSLGLSSQELLMVGDTIYDLQMARAAGVDSAAVTFGCHEEPLLRTEQPTYVVGSLAELGTLLLPE